MLDVRKMNFVMGVNAQDLERRGMAMMIEMRGILSWETVSNVDVEMPIESKITIRRRGFAQYPISAQYAGSYD